MTKHQRSWLLPPAAVALVTGIFLGRNAENLSPALCAVAFSLFAVILLNKRLRFYACIATSLAIGVLAGCIAFHPSLPSEKDYQIRGVISDEISKGSFGQYRLYLSDVTLDNRHLAGGAYWTFYDDEAPENLLPGKTVSFSASLYHPRGAVNPDGYNFRESLLQRGVIVGLYGNDDLRISDSDCFSFYGSVAAIRHRLSVSLRTSLGDETGSYASALLFGMRSLIPSEDRQAFENLGIAHILSVSGFHVSVLIGVLASLFHLLRLKQRIRICLYAIILSLYTALCGMSQPVIRASLLLLMTVEGKILNRPRSGLHLLCGTLFIMALLSPVQVTSASFQLTFCAMFGLVLFTTLIHRIRPFRGKLTQGILDSLILTFGIQLGLLFPELLFFQRFPLLVFLISLPASIFFGFLIALFWLAALMLPLFSLSSLLSGLLSAVTDFLLSGIRRLGSVPGLTLWFHKPDMFSALGIILLFLAFCTLFRLRGWLRAGLFAAGTVLLVLSLLPAPHACTEYIQFSAGNADAAILRDQDRTYVFDTGENDATLSSYLRIHRLIPDAVFITHLHADHAGGLRSMIDDGIPVPLIYLPEGAETQAIHPDFLHLLRELQNSGTEVRTLGRGDVIPLPSGTLTVLWPERGKTRSGQDANDYSLVSRLILKGTVFLQTGDLSGRYETYCAVPSDLLKASHHGSSSSTSSAFLSAVSPDAILLSCRQRSRLKAFQDRVGNIPVYCTSEYGALTVRFDDGGYTIIPFMSH